MSMKNLVEVFGQNRINSQGIWLRMFKTLIRKELKGKKYITHQSVRKN